MPSASLALPSSLVPLGAGEPTLLPAGNLPFPMVAPAKPSEAQSFSAFFHQYPPRSSPEPYQDHSAQLNTREGCDLPI